MDVKPRLEKVISSKISVEDFRLLEELARQYFFENKIKQPTVSHIVRAMIHSWVTWWDRQRKMDTPKYSAHNPADHKVR
jgi:hypothetical protein